MTLTQDAPAAVDVTQVGESWVPCANGCGKYCPPRQRGRSYCGLVCATVWGKINRK